MSYKKLLVLVFAIGLANNVSSALYYVYDVGSTDGTYGHNYNAAYDPVSFNTSDRYLAANTFGSSSSASLFWQGYGANGFAMYKYQATSGSAIQEVDIMADYYFYHEVNEGFTAEVYFSTTWDGVWDGDPGDFTAGDDWTALGLDMDAELGVNTFDTLYPNSEFFYIAYWGVNTDTITWHMQLQADQLDVRFSLTPDYIDGDANCDGVVSAGDYASVQANFGNTGDPHILGDANGDGVVSAGDYSSVQANFGNTAGAQSELVPEPATMGLLALSGLALIRKRR